MKNEALEKQIQDEFYYGKYTGEIKQANNDEKLLEIIKTVYHDGYEEARLYMLDGSLIKAFLRLITKGKLGKIN